MNLSINQPCYFNKTNYYSNITFRSGNDNKVYQRSADEITKIVSSLKDLFDGQVTFLVADKICDKVGICLGDKYLYNLVGHSKHYSLCKAINENPKKAKEVIERVLKNEENQGKTYDEVVDKMLAELEPQNHKAETDPNALRGAIASQVKRVSPNKHGGNGLKTSLNLEELSEYQKRLINEAKRELSDNQNVNLYTYQLGWGSYISPSSNPNMFLYVGQEDFNKMTDCLETLQRIQDGDGIFELSVLGSDKKALIKIPAEELTGEMKIIDTSIISGIHPFLIDITKYLDKHPEVIQKIEKNVGLIDLANVDPAIMQKIKNCV